MPVTAIFGNEVVGLVSTVCAQSASAQRVGDIFRRSAFGNCRRAVQSPLACDGKTLPVWTPALSVNPLAGACGRKFVAGTPTMNACTAKFSLSANECSQRDPVVETMFDSSADAQSENIP